MPTVLDQPNLPTVANSDQLYVISGGFDYRASATAVVQGGLPNGMVPVIGQVLTWNGTGWDAEAIGYPGGPPTGAAGGDLAGSYPDPTVGGLATYPVDLSISPTTGYVLSWNGSAWDAEAQPSSAPTGPAGGDLAGSYPDPTVGGLATYPVDLSISPTLGYVLTWNGSAWDAEALPSSAPTGPAGGDLSGSYPNPGVANIDGSPVLISRSQLPGYVLTWDGTEWADAAPPASLPPTGPAGGDLSGSYPNPGVANIDGSPVLISGSQLPGYVLTWDGTEWADAVLPAPGSPISIANDGGSVAIDGAGNITALGGSGAEFLWQSNTVATSLSMDDSGDIILESGGLRVLQGAPGGLVAIGTLGGVLELDPAADAYLQGPGGGRVTITSLGNITLVPLSGQGVGVFGFGPAPQQTALGTLAGFTPNTSANPVFNESTWDGGLGGSAYTIDDIVLALKNYGWIAP